MPTGGIGAASLAGYLSCPAAAAVGGSWLVTGALLADRDWASITDNCRRAVATVATVRGLGPR